MGWTLSAGAAPATRGGGAHPGSSPGLHSPPCRASLPSRGVPHPGPGHTHVLEEGAGVDGDAEALGAQAVRAQPVQRVRHGAHEAHDHRLAAPEEAVQERGQLPAQQASLGAGAAVGRGAGTGCPCPLPALPLGPRSSVRRPSLGPHPSGRLHGPPPGTHPGRVLWTAPSPLSPGRPRPSGSINPTLAGSWAPPSPVPVRTRGPLAWSRRPPLFSSTPPCLPPLSWPPHGSEEAGGAGPDKSVSRTYWGHQLPTSPGAQCASGGCGPPGSQ